MGQVFQPLLPPDTPIVSFQAPELIMDSPVLSISERVTLYRDALIAELGTHDRALNLVGYSLGGMLSFELALSLQGSMLDCTSLCLIDPSPCVPSLRQTIGTESYLMQRAQSWDLACSIFARRETTFKLAVASNDISCVVDLERHALSTFSDS